MEAGGFIDVVGYSHSERLQAACRIRELRLKVYQTSAKLY